MWCWTVNGGCPVSCPVNCWESMKCGREPGGARATELGVCAATTDERGTGVNGGMAGGRICWCIAGTFCRGQIQGSFALKFENCLMCPFFQQVEREQERSFVMRYARVLLENDAKD